MTISTLAFGKASASGSLKRTVQRHHDLQHGKQLYSTATAPSPKQNGGQSGPTKAEDSRNQRDLFLNILTANATKRDAKQYLARFKSPKSNVSGKADRLPPVVEERNARHRRDQERLDRIGVNLGGLYAPARAIADTPIFKQPGVAEAKEPSDQRDLHIALVCMRAPESLDDATLEGVATTLTQLVKLDMRIVIVLDCDSANPGLGQNAREALHTCRAQADRLSKAIERRSTAGARYIDGALQVSEDDFSTDMKAAVRQQTVSVSLPKLLLNPLNRSIIPILPNVAYDQSVRLRKIQTARVMTAISSLLSGLPLLGSEDGLRDAPTNTSLDRIIVLDPVGGIPSKARHDGAHVFINLEQEYYDIEAELAEYGHQVVKDEHSPEALNIYKQHMSNLSMLRECLSILPSASSALIITPQEAASASYTSQDSTIGTGTRRQRNTLIHNLLTNKPTVSSSLPVARLPASPITPDEDSHPAMPTSTVVKRGMPVTIIPGADPRLGWTVPRNGTTSLDLETDPRVDLPRLVHLIEDSFRRKLDLQHYLTRIRGRIAGLIIAGEYEGGAILTWEIPPNSTRLVPYLDKFAVLGSSQGSSGVADIVFQSMVRTCFPAGVCWRSRRDNPVNKWYFERAEGTWKIPESNWTMFWTGGGVVEDRERWEDYVGVCRSVGPSWADNKSVVD